VDKESNAHAGTMFDIHIYRACVIPASKQISYYESMSLVGYLASIERLFFRSLKKAGGMLNKPNVTERIRIHSRIAYMLAIAFPVLFHVGTVCAVDGTWNSNSSGNWGDSSKWLNTIVADGTGSTATFANAFSATENYVTNEINRTIGHISYQDNNSFLNIEGTNTLTLNDSSGTSVVYCASSSRSLRLNVPLSGTCALYKTGPGTLALTAAVTNTYNGGTVVNEGALAFSHDYNLGDPSGTITLNGGMLKISGTVGTDTHPVILVAATNIIEVGGNKNCYFSAPVSGQGGMVIQSPASGDHKLSFNSLSNTFTGVLGMDAADKRIEAVFDSLADSPGAGNIAFFPPGNVNNTFIPTIAWGIGATNALVLDNRRIELTGGPWSWPNRLKNGNATYPIIINTDFLVTGSGYKHFVFDANKANVTNVIAGDINDGTSGAEVAFTFSGAGDLILSGNNTHSGTNTFSGSGTLFLEGEASLPDDGTLNITGSGKVQVGKREKIGVLLINGVPVDPATGIWGSSVSGAANTNDTYFSGTGLLYVGVGFPPKGTIIVIR